MNESQQESYNDYKSRRTAYYAMLDASLSDYDKVIDEANKIKEIYYKYFETDKGFSMREIEHLEDAYNSLKAKIENLNGDRTKSLRLVVNAIKELSSYLPQQALSQ